MPKGKGDNEVQWKSQTVFAEQSLVNIVWLIQSIMHTALAITFLLPFTRLAIYLSNTLPQREGFYPPPLPHFRLKEGNG